jgi:hypothetical protein
VAKPKDFTCAKTKIIRKIAAAVSKALRAFLDYRANKVFKASQAHKA